MTDDVEVSRSGVTIMDAEHRTFLRGLLVGTAAGIGTATVKLADPREVRALTLHKPVLLGQPAPPRWEHALQAMLSGDPIYVKTDDGYRAIGYVAELHAVQTERRIENGWTGEVRYVPGLKSALIRFEGTEQL